MHPHLQAILTEQFVTTPDGGKYPLKDSVPVDEGYFLQCLVREIRPKISLEIGLAYGISAMFICEALHEVSAEKHIIIDPRQSADEDGWNGIGLYNLKQCGFLDQIEFYESSSEFILPQLLQKNIPLDFAFIDGWHTFDHALVDFFYINRMLRIGGVVVFDDANWPSIKKLIRYIAQFPAYQVFASIGGRLSRLNRALSGRQANPQLKDFRTGKIAGRAVALRKCSTDDRPWTWFKEF